MKLHSHGIRDSSRMVRHWWTLYTSDGESNNTKEIGSFSVEFCYGAGAEHTGAELSLGDSLHSIKTFFGAAHVADLWLHLDFPRISSWAYRKKNKLNDFEKRTVVELRFHDRAVWWRCWQDPHSWKSGTPKWRESNFHWWDWLVGKPVHSEEIVEGPIDTFVPMPERPYPIRVTIKKARWDRPRWWPMEVMRADIDILPYTTPDGRTIDPAYIPVPGKGENSWDCGGDGTFGMSCPAKTVEEAIGSLVESVLRDRRRRVGDYTYAELIS